MPTPTRLLLALSLATLAPSALSRAATLAHDYTLHDTYADSLGGPSLTPFGGTLSPAGYTFGPNQGLSVASALPDPSSYSILLDFQFSSTTGYRRILDFKNRTSDTGLYVLSNHLNFYNITTSSTDSFQPNTQYRLVLTRDAATKVTIAYLNGTPSFSFTDTSGLAIFSSTNNIANFFLDDTVVSNETSAGFVSRIAIYDAPLTPAAITQLGDLTNRIAGDANLNGTIDPDDFALLDRGRAQHLTGWSNGDFNADNTVNAADYLLIDRSYLLQTQSNPATLLAQRESQFGPAYVQTLLTSIPEPSFLAAYPLALALLLPLTRRIRT